MYMKYDGYFRYVRVNIHFINKSIKKLIMARSKDTNKYYEDRTKTNRAYYKKIDQLLCTYVC